MAKFVGAIGYGEEKETPANSGVYILDIVEKKVVGDLIRNARKLEDGESVNPDMTLQNSVSILADPYAMNHFFAIRYIKWSGSYWFVTNVQVDRPRLILRMGGVYNGPKA